MKEELIRVLNYKLNDINSDINALIDLNGKIDEESEKFDYVSRILDLFKVNDKTDIMQFSKISKEDFERLLTMVDSGVAKVFGTDSCNYDGLVYLINGINSGVSLSLTDEQKNGIEYFISALTEKRREYKSAVEGYKLVKTRYAINDVDELNAKKDNYLEILKCIDNGEYITNTDLVVEAVGFSELSKEEEVELLTYVLSYNSTIFNNATPKHAFNIKEEKREEVELPKEEYDFPKEDIVLPKEEINDTYFNEVKEEKEEKPKEDLDFTLHERFDDYFGKENNDELPKEEINDEFFNSSTEENKDEDIEIELPKEEEKEDTYVPFTGFKEDSLNDNNPFDFPFSNGLPKTDDEEEENDETIQIPEINEPKEEVSKSTEIDNDFKDVVDAQDYEEYSASNEESMSSTRDIQKMLNQYGVKEESESVNELVAGNVDNYQKILDTLKKHDILKTFEKNSAVLNAVLLESSPSLIEDVLKIIKEDLSVDDEDYVITTKIAIDTIPTIFIDDGGNYNNFVENIRTFKDLEINLINLFDFSKEVFVANHEHILKNLEIVKKYEIAIDYKNAKYLLLLPNIGDRIDYYVESVYQDTLKDQKFDGIDYVNNYTAKLNVVTDETIKRLRYASENGKKVFGSKPNSLSGEITNLKVNALDITPEYLDKFFDNDFANLTGEESREYVKLIHNSSNVGNYDDELEGLNKYRDGLRYDIDGILVSYNKVQRNYSILRSYGIDSKKALEFAVCYNLVITKEEYDKLNNLLEEIGGNK